MSALATIIDVPRNKDDLQWWSFAHMADHVDIVRVIHQVTGVRLDLFPLDPVTLGGTWVYNHAVMHQQINATLGIGGYNLTGVRWDDPGSSLDFFHYNYVEHQQAAQILRL